MRAPRSPIDSRISSGVNGPNAASGSALSTAFTIAMHAAAAARSSPTSLSTALAGVSLMSMRAAACARVASAATHAGFSAGLSPVILTRSNRQPHGRAQAAERRGAEDDVAAMAAHDVARDRQAEADAARGGVPRGIHAEERLEGLLALVGRDAGAVVVDRQLERAVGLMGGDCDRAAVAAGVGDQVGDAAAKRVGPELD